MKSVHFVNKRNNGYFKLSLAKVDINRSRQLWQVKTPVTTPEARSVNGQPWSVFPPTTTSKVNSVNTKNKLLEFIFYGNYFYGVCAVALSIETSLQQHFSLNGLLYFVLIFMTTVLYYVYPYVKKRSRGNNPRTNWYTQHYNLMRWNQITITVILLISLVLFVNQQWGKLLNTRPAEWLLFFIFPVAGSLYYGSGFLFGKYSLRKIGWLKPFVIGFTWAGLVTIYPVLFYDMINGLHYKFNSVGGLLFLKNLMFITVLCIMFDIKDYTVDYITRLKTFVVQAGLRKTIFYVLMPLSIIGLASFILYGIVHQFQVIKILLNTIPFVLLIIVIYSLHKRRSLLYYLVIVDGLMLVKAICGSIAMIYF